MPWSLRMTLIVAGLLLVFFLYTGSRLFWAFKMLNPENSWLFKSIVIAAGFLFLFFPIAGLVQYSIYGIYNPDLFPKFVIYLFWYGFIFSAVMVSWTLFLDLFMVTVKRGFSINPPELDTLFAWLMAAISILVLLYTGIKTSIDTNRIKINKIEYSRDKSGISFEDPLNIIHISDLQADRFTNAEKAAAYIKKVNSLNPDLVFFTGDLIYSGTAYALEGAEALSQIKSEYDIYAVIGDHDYWSGEDIIAQALRQNGIHVLQNKEKILSIGNQKISITGITEIYSKKLLKDELQNLFHSDGEEAFSVVFSHQVTDRVLDMAKGENVNLLLGGHTHGGQLRIPFFFYPLTAVRTETKYVKGHKWFDDLLMNINSGLGYTLAPLRYGAPAEITLITLD